MTEKRVEVIYNNVLGFILNLNKMDKTVPSLVAECDMYDGNNFIMIMNIRVDNSFVVGSLMTCV